MRRLRFIGLALTGAGIALIAASVAMGQGQVYLLLFIPVYAGTGALGFLGIVVMFLGFFLASFGSAMRGIPSPTETASGGASPPGVTAPFATAHPARYGGVVMIGPIPIVFGSDARIAKWMMVLGLILAAFVVAAFVLFSLRAIP